MANLRIWIILSWIALPTVMFGGYSLLRLLNRGDALTPFQVDRFRAGRAHCPWMIPAARSLIVADPFNVSRDVSSAAQ